MFMDVAQKITRRAVLGTVIVGLGTAPFVIRYLREPYEVNLPSTAQSFAPSQAEIFVNVRDDGYTLKVPPVKMEVKNPEDLEKLRHLVREAVAKASENDPGYKAHKKQKERDFKAKLRKDINISEKPLQEQMEDAILRFNEKLDDGSMIETEIRRYNEKIDNSTMMEIMGDEIRRYNEKIDNSTMMEIMGDEIRRYNEKIDNSTMMEIMGDEIRRYNEKIDNDTTLDVKNKELMKKGFLESMEKSWDNNKGLMKKDFLESMKKTYSNKELMKKDFRESMEKSWDNNKELMKKSFRESMEKSCDNKELMKKKFRESIERTYKELANEIE
jgi:hypothetical protein